MCPGLGVSLYWVGSGPARCSSQLPDGQGCIMTGASSKAMRGELCRGTRGGAERPSGNPDVRGLHHSWEIKQPEILIRTTRPARLLWPRLPSSPTTHQSSWESCGAYLPTSSAPYSSMKSGCSRSTDRSKCTKEGIVVSHSSVGRSPGTSEASDEVAPACPTMSGPSGPDTSFIVDAINPYGHFHPLMTSRQL